ncbi:MAG: hypothetical protein ACRC5G_03340 [Cetobacterium sp.]
MKKLELNSREFNNLVYQARLIRKAEEIQHKIFNGIIIVVMPMTLAMELGL